MLSVVSSDPNVGHVVALALCLLSLCSTAFTHVTIESDILLRFDRASKEQRAHYETLLEQVAGCEWGHIRSTARWVDYDVLLRTMNGSFSDHPELAFYIHGESIDATDFSSTGYAWQARNLTTRAAEVQRCTADGFVAERVGSFHSTGGHDWHSFGWNDAGGFASMLDATRDTWVTMYAFLPVSVAGAVMGLPPIHIHHEHVTSSQDIVRFYDGEIFGKWNTDGARAVEFDVHGDRECFSQDGGMACLPVFLPQGFGYKIVEAMETFGQLNDVRPRGSANMSWYALHAYRYHHGRARQVARLVTGIGAGTGDSTELVFEPGEHVQEYLMWGEKRFSPYNVTIFSSFWHTHHEYTEDMWLLLGPAYLAGLGQPPLQGR